MMEDDNNMMEDEDKCDRCGEVRGTNADCDHCKGEDNHKCAHCGEELWTKRECERCTHKVCDNCIGEDGVCRGCKETNE